MQLPEVVSSLNTYTTLFLVLYVLYLDLLSSHFVFLSLFCRFYSVFIFYFLNDF